MKRRTTAPSYDLEGFADDAKALIAATAHVAEDKIVEARKRLTSALETGTNVWELARDKAVEGVHATDEMVRHKPYQVIGVAFGVGALLGFLINRRG